MSALTRFLIVGMQRSGTTVTHNCLAGHPQVSLAEDEVSVDPFFTKGLAVFTTGRESFAVRQRGFRGLFDAISLAGTDQPGVAAGLKVALNNPEHAIDLVEAVREYFDGLRIVRVRRQDLVAQCASLWRAMRTGQWHSYIGGRPASDDKFSIPVADFDAYVDGCQRIEAQLDRLAETNPVCELIYERDIEPGMDHGRLFDFVGAPRMPVTWIEMTKVSPPVSRFLVNHAELAARLQNTPPADPARTQAETTLRRREAARRESDYLLLTRAEERSRRGHWAEIGIDLATLAERTDKLEPWIAGRAAGLLEAATTHGAPAQPEALAALNQTAGTNPAFYEHRGAVSVQYARPEAAIADLRRATLDLTSPATSHAWVGWLVEEAHRQLKDDPALLAMARQLTGRYPDSAPYHFLLAVAAYRNGDRETSRQQLLRALQIDPKHAKAQDWLTRLG